jgi:hypothetical protein
MTFEEVLGQVRELLQSKQRVSYRALKRQFALDDDYLEDLKAELIKAERVAADEDGDVLVWTGGAPKSETATSPASSDPRPQTQDARPTDGERRQLTVEFIGLCRKVDSNILLSTINSIFRVSTFQYLV